MKVFFIHSPLENLGLKAEDESVSVSTSDKPRTLVRGSRRLFFLTILLVLTMIDYHFCSAEKIYLKDGQITNAKIDYRTKNSIWVKKGSGSIGIDLAKIDRIENDDGTISKLDYKTICSLVQERIKAKNYIEATRLCSLLLESFPDDAQIHYLRGMLNHKIGDFKNAIGDYNFLIEQNAASANTLNNLGTIYVNDKEYKKAQDLFIKAIKENPDMQEAHENLAVLFLQTEDYSNAIEEYKKVIALNPNNSDSKNALEYLQSKINK